LLELLIRPIRGFLASYFPSDGYITLFWSVFAGVAGALATMVFR